MTTSTNSNVGQKKGKCDCMKVSDIILNVLRATEIRWKRNSDDPIGRRRWMNQNALQKNIHALFLIFVCFFLFPEVRWTRNSGEPMGKKTMALPYFWAPKIAGRNWRHENTRSELRPTRDRPRGV